MDDQPRRPDKRQTDFFNGNFGESSAGLTILRRAKHLFHRVVGQTPIEKLAPYFGTEGPVPADGVDRRQEGPSRGADGAHVGAGADAAAQRRVVLAGEPAQGQVRQDPAQTAQTKMDQRAQYRCLYRARLTYSATLITSPKPPTKPKT